jgi:dipeptidyl aminopeptidase/acylaminoacyl peptidase
MGVADPKRLGLMGHSFGGYTTYCLITQTNKFQAAAALAGPTDYASYYGIFDTTLRYGPLTQELSWKMFDIEGTDPVNSKMGTPPWKDLNRFIRNSPLTYVERVETPVLIIQGDMDFVPIQQGESFFNSLHRQNKRARFVRYWGEGHILQSPANIRDMWQQVYRWFDELLVKTTDKP